MKHEAKFEVKYKGKGSSTPRLTASVEDTLSKRLLMGAVITMCFALILIFIYIVGNFSEKCNESLKIIICGAVAIVVSLVASILVRKAKRYPLK
jgi:Protein export membrane protein.